MNRKLIMALVDVEKTDVVLEAARRKGPTGATVITSVRGEGLNPGKTFFGLELTGQRDVLLFLVAGNKAREILDTIASEGRFDEEPGSGIAFQVSIEDAVGLKTQESLLLDEIEESI